MSIESKRKEVQAIIDRQETRIKEFKKEHKEPFRAAPDEPVLLDPVKILKQRMKEKEEQENGKKTVVTNRTPKKKKRK